MRLVEPPGSRNPSKKLPLIMNLFVTGSLLIIPFAPVVDGVILCVTESLLIQVTVIPSDTIMVLGLNSLPSTQISFGPGDGIGSGEGEGVGITGLGRDWGQA